MFTPAWSSDPVVDLASDDARERPETVLGLKVWPENSPDALEKFPGLRVVHAHGAAVDDRWIDALAALPSVAEIHFVKFASDAATIKSLARIAGLRSVSFAFNPDVPDNTLAALGSLPDLERVDIRYTGAAAGTLAALTKLPRLREMWIGSTKIPGAALAKIPPMPSLTLLEANGMPWTAKALSAVSALPALRALDVSRVKKFSSAFWSDLAARGVLERISIAKTLITPAELAALVKGAPLREIDAEECRLLTDAAIASLGAIPTLTQLSISFSSHLSDAALQGLTASTSLRSLHLVACGGFTQAGLASLAKIASLREIDAFLNPLEDATLLTWVQSLPLERCDVAHCPGLSPVGYRAAHAARPSCAIRADELIMGEERPELYADRAFLVQAHDAAVNRDATAFVVDYPGEMQALDAQGAQRAKRNSINIGNLLDFAQSVRWLIGDQSNGKITVWDALTNKAPALPGLIGYQPHATITPDGGRVAVVLSLELTVIDLPSNTRVFSTRLGSVPSRLLFSDDRRLLMIGNEAGVHIFDLENGGARITLDQCVEPLAFDRGALIASNKERAICAMDPATGQEIERWEPYVTARRAWVVGSHHPSFAVAEAPRLPVYAKPMISQWVRTANGYVAVAGESRGSSELITPELIVHLGQRDGNGRWPRLSGNGRWILWPSEMAGKVMLRLWSVEALLDFARPHAVSL